jgi:hypothetical protein
LGTLAGASQFALGPTQFATGFPDRWSNNVLPISECLTLKLGLQTSKGTVVSDKIFYAIGNKRIGPVSLADIKTLALRGELKRTDRVWTQGMADWSPAGVLQEVFDELPPDLPTTPEESSFGGKEPRPTFAQSLQAVDSLPALINCWLRSTRVFIDRRLTALSPFKPTPSESPAPAKNSAEESIAVDQESGETIIRKLCVSCNEAIPENASLCQKCGWSQPNIGAVQKSRLEDVSGLFQPYGNRAQRPAVRETAQPSDAASDSPREPNGEHDGQIEDFHSIPPPVNTPYDKKKSQIRSAVLILALFGVLVFVIRHHLNEARMEEENKAAVERNRPIVAALSAEQQKRWGKEAGFKIAEAYRASGARIPNNYELRLFAERVWQDPTKFDAVRMHGADYDTEQSKEGFIDDFAEGYQAYYQQFQRAF